MRNVLRIIDANANRAREALRVMEEAARFLLDNQTLTRELKTLRHDLAVTLAKLPSLELHRDTPGDVGTTVTTESEQHRSGTDQVIVAAGKRLTEALRAIEEYGKTLPQPLTTIEALRYRAYELERQLHTMMRVASPHLFRLCLLLTESLCTPHPWTEVLDQAIMGGVDCVQVREKQMSDAALLDRTCEIVKRCHAKQVAVVVNDRPDLALLAEADGVHLGQTDLPADQVRKIVGRQLLIGVSTSNLNEAEKAAAMGADYCGVGPMFPTTTKQKKNIAGPDYLKAYLAPGMVLTCGVAIGGINPGNLDQLTNLGVKSIAVSSCICASPQPGRVTEQLRTHLEATTLL